MQNRKAFWIMQAICYFFSVFLLLNIEHLFYVWVQPVDNKYLAYKLSGYKKSPPLWVDFSFIQILITT